MAKGYGQRGGNFGGMNINQLMKQAKKMQADVEKSQEELSEKEFDSTVGGGAVTVVVSGDKKLKSIKIDKDAMDPEDPGMLEDLVLTCVNDALSKVDDAQAQTFSQFNIPGLM